MRKIIKLLFNPGTNIGFAIISLCLAIIPEQLFLSLYENKSWSVDINVLVNRVVAGIAILVLINIFYWLFYFFRNQVTISGRNYSVQIEYNDILKIKKGKVLIHFDECFTSSVGDDLDQIKPQSVCGQFLTKHQGIDVKRIAREKKILPSGQSNYQARERYDSGTIVPYENYLLLAFAKLNNNGKAYMTYEDYIDSLDKMWEEISYYYNNQDVYIPLLGGKITRFDSDLSQQELLDIIISSYRISPWKLLSPNKLHIVCNKNEKNKNISLYKIFGVN